MFFIRKLKREKKFIYFMICDFIYIIEIILLVILIIKIN